MSTKVSIHELTMWLNDELEVNQWQDSCPNGLQVEGTTLVSHIVTGVTASERLLKTAIQLGADSILVHHGWFWKNEDPCIRGTRRTRLALALEHNLNILAYHLPLDAHSELGNNAQLARILGLIPVVRADLERLYRVNDLAKLIWWGSPPQTTTLSQLEELIRIRLSRTPLVIGNAEKVIRNIALCTGSAEGLFLDAVNAGADVYITGEISEQVVHLARETGVGFISAGHHATERYGIQALGKALSQHFDLYINFIDIDNPV